jgi:hypothetical protein
VLCGLDILCPAFVVTDLRLAIAGCCTSICHAPNIALTVSLTAGALPLALLAAPMPHTSVLGTRLLTAPPPCSCLSREYPNAQPVHRSHMCPVQMPRNTRRWCPPQLLGCTAPHGPGWAMG